MKKQIFGGIFIITILVATLGAIPSAVSAHGDALGCIKLSKNLSVGSKDVSVLTLQNYLHVYGYLDAEPTGYFGNLTFAAVVKYQKHANVPAIGLVGPMTRAAIQKSTCTTVVIPTEVPAALPPKVVQPQTASLLTAVTPVVTAGTLPYRVENFEKWYGTWGAVTHDKTGYLEIKATPMTSGAEAHFDGGSDWTDYRYSADVSVWNGDVTLMARYVDEKNFVTCTFDGNGVTIRQHVNGVASSLASGGIPDLSPGSYFAKSFNVSITVKGQTASCSATGGIENVTTTKVDPSLTKGSIGMQTWFKTQGAAIVILRNVAVVAVK